MADLAFNTPCAQCANFPELWRPVPIAPYGERYEISSHGRIRTIRHSKRFNSGHIRALSTHPFGHKYISLFIGSKGRRFWIHRLVALAFHGEPPTPSHEAAHWDGDPSHNHVGNIRWATSAENKADTVRIGRAARGTRHGLAKLSDNAIRSIRARYAAGRVTQNALAEEFGVHRVTISKIVCGIRWKHVPASNPLS